MNYYEMSLVAMKKILDDCGEGRYSAFVGDCITDWKKKKNTDRLTKGFSKGGLFESFSFRKSDFDSPEKEFWTNQCFGAMVAMTMQLARFEHSGRDITIDFIRKNFGHPAEVISGSKCTDCGRKELNMEDIDKYITSPVVAKAVVDGLENGDLNENLDKVISLEYDYLLSERENAIARAMNTNVSVSNTRDALTVCKNCGGKNIVKCRFLKSLKTNTFVALSR